MEFYSKVKIASCNGLIVWFFFVSSSFLFLLLSTFNAYTLAFYWTLWHCKNVKVDRCCCIKNYHHQCTLLVRELEETMDNVYIYQAKESNLFLFRNLVSIFFFVILICWKFCKTMKHQQNVWKLKICDTCCARGNHLSKEG